MSYQEHLQNRERDLQLSNYQALVEPLDRIAAKFEDRDEREWRRRMAIEIQHLREELKRRD